MFGLGAIAARFIPAGLLGSGGKYVLIFVAFLAWTAYQRYDAKREARTECNEKNLQLEITELKRRVAAQEKLVKDAQKQEAETQKELDDAAKERDAAIEEQRKAEAEADAAIAKLGDKVPPAGKRCTPVGPSVTKRLRNIR